MNSAIRSDEKSMSSGGAGADADGLDASMHSRRRSLIAALYVQRICLPKTIARLPEPMRKSDVLDAARRTYDAVMDDYFASKSGLGPPIAKYLPNESEHRMNVRYLWELVASGVECISPHITMLFRRINRKKHTLIPHCHRFASLYGVRLPHLDAV